MLFVDDGQRQRPEDHVVLDQRVGAQQQVEFARCQSCKDIAALLAFFSAGENGHAQAGVGGQRRDGLDMLPR